MQTSKEKTDMDTSNQTLVALFANRTDAYSGITGLLHAGFDSQRVGFLDPTDVLFGTETGRTAGPYVEKLKNGRVLVSADVAGIASGTEAATVLLESHALAVASLAMRAVHPHFRHPMRTAQPVFAA